MGLFIKNHGNYDGPLITGTPQNPYNENYVGSYLNMGMTSIFGILTKVAEAKGDDDDDVSGKNKQKIEELTNKIDKKLREANASTIAELSSKISASQEAQKTLSNQIQSTNNSICSTNNKIINLKASESELLLKIKTADASKKTSLEAELKTLRAEMTTANNELNRLKESLKKQEKELKAEKAKEAKFAAISEKIKGYQDEIDMLKRTDSPSEPSQDVKQQTDYLSAFNNACKDYEDNSSVTTAKALSKAYEDGKFDQNSSVKTKYDLLKKKHPELFTARDS